MKPHALVVAVSIAASLASTCAKPLQLNIAPTPRHARSTDATPVQVRYFSVSPGVAVVAWDTTDSWYGLRAWIRPDGTLVRDHQIYVSTYYEAGARGYPYANVGNKNLQMTGTSRDIYACWFGKPCSPQETYGAIIPDEVLRTAADSVNVRFYTSARQLVLPLHHDLIVAYLAKVDSICAQLRKQR